MADYEMNDEPMVIGEDGVNGESMEHVEGDTMGYEVEDGMDIDDVPVSQEDAWAVISWVKHVSFFALLCFALLCFALHPAESRFQDGVFRIL